MTSQLDATHLLLPLASFWAALYALRRYRRRAALSTFLPAPSSSRSLSLSLFKSSATRLTLRNFHLNLQTTACNALHKSLAMRLARHSCGRTLLVLAYDAGSILGVLGMPGSVLLLAWTTVQLFISLGRSSTVENVTSATNQFHKRDLPAVEASLGQADTHGVPLQLIIPGVTIPLHHLPLLLVALLVNQIIHEAGHFLTASLDAVPLSSAGLGLTVILPSAFVAFPSEETESLSLRSRMRITSAGAFHNVLFWLILSGAAWARVSNYVWPLLGYKDVSAYGRVVVNVNEDSPLFGHLPVGVVVYKLGDDTLDGPRGAADRWEALLSHKPDTPGAFLGWCAGESWFTAQNTSCCASRRSEILFQSCFVPSDNSFERCLDPLLFLDIAEGEFTRRCTTAVDCGRGQLCIGPRRDQEILSLTMHIPPWLRVDDRDLERTVVWQGDRIEILHEVEVGNWLPSYGVLPIELPVLVGTLFTYLNVLTLSLYFFNLLPLPFLDGGQLLDALHDRQASLCSEEDAQELAILDELEGALGNGSRTSYHTRNAYTMKSGWRRVMHVGVGMLLGTCIVLSLANTYL